LDRRASSLPQAKGISPLQAFGQAVAFHDRGRLWEAAQLYEIALRADDRHLGAVYRFGLLRMQQGKFDDAERLFRRAVKLDKRSADAQLHLAAALTGLDRLEEAIRHYERALELKPAFAEAHNNLGYVLQRLGKHEQAIGHYEKALATNPDYAEARNNFGNALQMLERSEEAVLQYEKAIAIRPNYAEAHNNLGNVLGTLRRNEEAIRHHEQAIALRPNYAEAYLGLGDALKALDRHEEAVAHYEKALTINPNYAEAHSSFGNALEVLGRPDAALEHYAQALAIRPEHPEAHVDLGNAYLSLGRCDEALASYEQALAIKPDFHGSRWNRSLVCLLTEDWNRGWRDYEARWEAKQSQHKRNFAEPLWLGQEPLQGRKILLHAEQGLGDAFMVLRYVPRVADAGAEVILELPASLTSLLARAKGVTQVIEKGQELPRFDLHCPLMSLPLAFGTTLETVPGEVPYVWPERDRVLEWRQRLGDVALPRVGVAWHGNALPDPKRSIPIQTFGEIDLPGVELVSLHQEIPDEVRDVLPRHRIRYFGDQIRDFSDTAALIALMDFVISIDTSVAHLAGAMGKPTWILLPFSADWRWLCDREDSVWYPTARLFRQPRIGDWDSVLQRVRQELATHFASR
jgi:tetratricopeptide (TPR) repeat protein